MQFSFEPKVKYPDVTICHSDFEQKLGQFFPCAYDWQNPHQFTKGIINCLQTNSETTIQTELTSMEFADLGTPFLKNLTLVSNSGHVAVLDIKTMMKKVFHEKYGICYTLEEKYWNR